MEQDRRRKTGSAVLNLQFLELLADEGLSREASAGRVEESPAGTMADRLQDLLGGEVPRATRTPVPLAQRLFELTSAQDTRIEEPAIQIMGNMQASMERGPNLQDDIAEVADTDSEKYSDGESNPVLGESHVSEPSQSMMQRFQHALEAASNGEDNLPLEHSRISVFGFSAQLQKVLQRERDQISTFSKAWLMGHAQNDASKHMVLRILSKYREARLSTCSCEVLVAPEDWFNNGEDTAVTGDRHHSSRIIQTIFSSKASSDLDLEVGRVVRIDHPWREITNAEGFWKIVVCTYFSTMV